MTFSSQTYTVTGSCISLAQFFPPFPFSHLMQPKLVLKKQIAKFLINFITSALQL